MISIKFKLEKNGRKGTEFPILLRARLGKQKYQINTGKQCSEENFVNGRIKGKTT